MKLTRNEFIDWVTDIETEFKRLDRLSPELGIQGSDGPMYDFVNKEYSRLWDMCEFSSSQITKEFGSPLDYYCWELDFGNLAKDLKVTDADGNVLDYGDLSVVYDDIVEGQEFVSE